MSPFSAVVFAILVGVACAGVIAQDSAANYRKREVSFKPADNEQAAVTESHPDDVTTTLAPITTAEPSTDAPTPQAPLAHAVSRVSSTLTSGDVNFAYKGQTHHAVDTDRPANDARSFPATELHYEVPATFYHPEHLQGGEVVALARADHLPATYIQHEQPRFLTAHGPTAFFTPATYDAPQPAITHFTQVQPQPVREQTFSVNLASPKYGYGYTVRGIQHAQ